jgi:hypothetical protein
MEQNIYKEDKMAMVDIQLIAKELKEALNPYNFIQKGTSRIFFYDCGWYLIVAEIIQMKTKAGIKTDIVTGINFCWDNTFAFSVGMPKSHDDTARYYSIIDFSQKIKEDICEWINSRKDIYLNIYKNPIDMVKFIKVYNDIHHQPHGYIISRIFKDKIETQFFEKEAVDLLKEYNTNHSIYFLPSHKNSEKTFRELEAFINKIIRINDNEFIDEINKRINEKRKKLKLKILGKYF